MPFCAVLSLFAVEVEEDDSEYCKKLMRGLHCAGPASHGVSSTATQTLS